MSLIKRQVMSTSTSTSTTIKDGKVVTTKTVTTTGPDGKKTMEMFVEEKEAGEENSFGGDFFKKRMEEMKVGSADEDEKREGKKEAAKAEVDTETPEEEQEGGFTTFQLEALKAHNDFRVKHGVPPMELCQKVCSYAQDWAETLIRENKFQHRSDSKYGENLYSSWSSRPKKVSGSVAVESWYAEVEHYTFGQEPRGGPTTGHFTQVVWKESTKLGIAIAQKDGKVIVVGNYSPAGNYCGLYTANVPALV